MNCFKMCLLFGHFISEYKLILITEVSTMSVLEILFHVISKNVFKYLIKVKYL